MTEDELEREVEDLTEMILSLRLIKDQGRRRWLIAEIRTQLNRVIRN